MASFWIGFESGNYYVGDQSDYRDIEVPPRPTIYHHWINGAWVEDVTAATIAAKTEEIAAIQASFTDTVQMKAIVELASIIDPVVLETLDTAQWVIDKTEEVDQLKADIEALENP